MLHCTYSWDQWVNNSCNMLSQRQHVSTPHRPQRPWLSWPVQDCSGSSAQPAAAAWCSTPTQADRAVDASLERRHRRPAASSHDVISIPEWRGIFTVTGSAFCPISCHSMLSRKPLLSIGIQAFCFSAKNQCCPFFPQLLLLAVEYLIASEMSPLYLHTFLMDTKPPSPN